MAVDVLSTLTAAAYDSAGWTDPDPLTVVRFACLLGLIEKSATAAILVAVIPPRAIGYDWAYGLLRCAASASAAAATPPAAAARVDGGA
jgi:hypothetical protein